MTPSLEQADTLLSMQPFTLRTIEIALALTNAAAREGSDPLAVEGTIQRIRQMLHDILPAALTYARTIRDRLDRRHAFATTKQVAALFMLVTNDAVSRRRLARFIIGCDTELALWEAAS